MRRKIVQLLGGPCQGRTRLDIADDGPIPVTISATIDAIAHYEYVGGGIFVYIGSEIAPEPTSNP